MELGWGGYWAWDPVENASLLPWLIGTASLHTGLLEIRRGKLHRVNIFLMGLTTVSAFFATYLVRGNVVNSVHAFGDGGVGTPLLFFVLFSLAVVFFIAFCARNSRSSGLGGLETREGFVVMTVWLLIALSLIVLLATLWPVISRLWLDRPLGLDAGFYNHVCLPLFTVLLALLLVCPWLRWQGGFRKGRKLFPCLLAFGSALIVFWMNGITKALPLMAASLSIAVIVGMGMLLAERSTRAWMPSVMACLVHISVALMALAIAFSGPYKQEVEVELAPQGSAQVGPWTVTLTGLNEGRGSNYAFLEAELQLSQKGESVATVLPQRRLYDKFQRAFSEATTYPGLGTEFYVTLLGLHEGKAVLRMSANPLVNWLWIGGALMSLAPLLGLSRRRRPAALDNCEEREGDGKGKG